MIFSRSAKSLQIIFNKLESFCENANLSVNLDKTKIMIFNNCGKSLNNYRVFQKFVLIFSSLKFHWLLKYSVYNLSNVIYYSFNIEYLKY